MNAGTIIVSWLITLVIVVAAGAMIGGWLLMLTVGVIHGEWLPMIPTLGYWSAVKVGAMLSLMFGFGFGLANSRS